MLRNVWKTVRKTGTYTIRNTASSSVGARCRRTAALVLRATSSGWPVACSPRTRRRRWKHDHSPLLLRALQGDRAACSRKTLQFGRGLTAITGPNEAGKSFVIEMMRYAFFGSAALRGVGEDYNNLSVAMRWATTVSIARPKAALSPALACCSRPVRGRSTPR